MAAKVFGPVNVLEPFLRGTFDDRRASATVPVLMLVPFRLVNEEPGPLNPLDAVIVVPDIGPKVQADIVVAPALVTAARVGTPVYAVV